MKYFMDMIGIYKITSPTNKIYIGQSSEIAKRFRTYQNLSGSRQQTKLNRSFQKYGIKNHIFEIIEECTWEQLNIRERFWQEHYNTLNIGLNCWLTNTDILPQKHSDESKRKIGNANRGKTHSEETKSNISTIVLEQYKNGKINPFYGKNHNTETKNKISTIRYNAITSIILNHQTGVFYNSVSEAARSINMDSSHLMKIFKGKYKNKTNLIKT